MKSRLSNRPSARELAHAVASRGGALLLDLVLAAPIAVVLYNVFIYRDVSWSGLLSTLILTLVFGLPLLAAFWIARQSRRRGGPNAIAKASTSLIMATGLYYFATGAGRLVAFYGPFIGAEFQNAKEWGGYGPLESVPYVIEGVIWSYEHVRLVFPNASSSFELGGFVLVVGIVFELSRYGIARKVES